MNIISSFVFLSFFIFFPMYIITGLRTLDFSFLLLSLYTFSGVFFLGKTINKKVIISILLFILFISFNIFIGFILNDDITVSIKQSLYYFKPILFFLFGYLFLTKSKYKQYVNYVLVLSVLGTICFILFENDVIKYTMMYLGTTEVGYFYSFGFMVRNISFFISPLEFGGICFYLLFFYLASIREFNLKKVMILSLIVFMIISTMSRTVWLVCIFGMFSYYLIGAKSLNKLSSRYSFIILMMFAATILVINNFSLIDKYFISDGSSSVHHSNLIETLSYIISYPFGTGLGSSGWSGYDLNLNFYHYSEGSFFANCIELGLIQYITIILFISIYIFKLSKDMFVIFVGYILGCMIIPLGFSTFINLLFFSYLGIISKNGNKI
ncbi:hypothetical protein [Photobacterium damselae]|uniref:hypothetical protein n=1 Tax=Photobacterium damselae TaxID=38293 RepID=UPI001592F93F|nr:hypothetical protein [Photobacterium damselae]NVH48269.1 hypothetical protein [Photobacterium damselae subsp. damselae]